LDIRTLFPTAQWLDIKLPTGDPTGIRFKLVGQDSGQFRTAAKKFAAEFVENDSKKKFDPELLERQQVEICTACIIDWDGVSEGDQPLTFTKEKLVEVISLPEAAWLREQVSDYITARTNFFRRGAQAPDPVGGTEGGT